MEVSEKALKIKKEIDAKNNKEEKEWYEKELKNQFYSSYGVCPRCASEKYIENHFFSLIIFSSIIIALIFILSFIFRDYTGLIVIIGVVMVFGLWHFYDSKSCKCGYM